MSKERLANIKQYYSSMKSLDPDIQEDMRFLIDRVDSLMAARGIVSEIYGHYVLKAKRYREALENIEDIQEINRVPSDLEVLEIVRKALEGDLDE